MASEPGGIPDEEAKAVPTAFVSYAHGDDAWDATVLDFATALRTVGGIDADLDKWHLIDGQDWSQFGPTGIRTSDFTLLVASRAYMDAWQETDDCGQHAGAAREAATIKTIFNKNRSDFKQRVKIVLLPGAGEDEIPADIAATLEHFVVSAFDLRGLDALLRSMLHKPRHALPPLGPPPALPPLPALPTSTGAHTRGDARSVADVPGGDRAIAQWLAARLAALAAKIAAHPAAASDRTGDQELAQLRKEHAATAEALAAVQRALSPVGAARQRMVGDYLDAQVYFSAGAFCAADRRLQAVYDRLEDRAAYPANAELEPCLRVLTESMLELNRRMRAKRYAAVPKYRHPDPPRMKLDRDRAGGVGRFYEVARCAMKDGDSGRSQAVIRTAILRGRTDKHAVGLYARFTEQQEIARVPLSLAPPTAEGNGDGAYLLAEAHLDGTADGVASDVLAALAKSHLEIHLVERRRSGPVGAIIDRGKQEIDKDREYLRRSIVLNTFALSISENLPWIFAANEAERKAIQTDPVGARRDLLPAAAMWPARQVTMLALYRRSHGFRLLGDHERAYNDLRMLQRVGRLTRLARPGDAALTGCVDTLVGLAEYRIGELYRADHDYMQALVHLCRSHDSVQALDGRPGSAIANELGHLEIKLSLGKAKAFFEIGAMKRSLKWHLTAWRWLLALESPASDADRELKKGIMLVEEKLDRVKHDLVLYKDDVQAAVAQILEQMCERELTPGHEALEADILVRIGHLLTVLRLTEDSPQEVVRGDSSALRCMKRAARLDRHNLLVHTGLLRYEMRRPGSIRGRSMPDPMLCWPSGASDVDQVIRVAEHLMLERLHAAGGPNGTEETGVARALMGHFMTHTDSINLRGAILHRYLMRGRVEDRELWWSGAGCADNGTAHAVSSATSTPCLEFVCLRRFGSFTPFMPRPAAVSAVGGGYLVRVVRSQEDDPHAGATAFNIVVDPGEGTVNNLYAMGLSIADIDMVVATHDHPEHLSALDAILSLRQEFEDRELVNSAVTAGPLSRRGPRPRLLILGNRSVVNRYSFLNGDGRHLVQHIADAEVLGGDHVPAGVQIEQLPTKHKDLGGHHASGFVLSYSDPHADDDGRPLRIAFMADTSIEGLRTDQDPAKPIEPAWGSALESDIVVAHVSDVPSGELRAIAELPAEDDQGVIDEFDAAVRKLATERPSDASQLMHALSLVPPDPEANPQPVSLLSPTVVNDGDQLYLEGLLNVCKLMSTTSPASDGTRILIVGELKEQLGSFRGTIAREINTCMLRLPQLRHGTAPALIALTADIGLRIRLTSASSTHGPGRRSTVLCSTCSYNNDRLDLERFHPPHEIYDVCVKGDHEALYWNCELHDPGQRKRAMFVEQMGGYNPFAAGGRYHG